MRRCLACIEEGMGFNRASKEFGIPKPTIRRHRLGLNKYAKGDIKLRGGPCALPKEVEDELVSHIKSLDDLFFGLSILELRKLAYEVACAHGISAFSDEKKAANKTWYYNFMKRHPELRLRTPEPTSMARTKGFNRNDVDDFFEKYCELIDEHGFTAEKIYNVDETGHSTVQKPSKVISTKGKRQVGATTSAERGTNTTGVYCHSATGHFLPPMLIFKRKRMADTLKVDAPTGTVFACTDSGWIDTDVFTQWMKHFIQSVNSSKENKHLLLLDGHTSHSKNLATIKWARENGVFLLSFPPHTTHRMQPLDVSFFKSLKNWYNIEVETYLRSSHGKTVNVYLVSKLVGKAFIKAATMESAVNGFRKAGLWPPNRHVFDGEFDRIEALTAPYTDELTGCQTPPPTGRGEDNHSTSRASNVDNNAPLESTQPLHSNLPDDEARSDTQAHYPTDATTGPADAMHTTSSTTPDSNVGSVRSPNEQPNNSPDHCTIPTQGDGRCFFRSVVIGLNCDLQSGQRNPVTGVIIDTMKSLLETARADNLRTMVISHMCEKVCGT